MEEETRNRICKFEKQTNKRPVNHTDSGIMRRIIGAGSDVERIIAKLTTGVHWDGHGGLLCLGWRKCDNMEGSYPAHNQRAKNAYENSERIDLVTWKLYRGNMATNISWKVSYRLITRHSGGVTRWSSFTCSKNGEVRTEANTTGCVAYKIRSVKRTTSYRK